MNKPIEPYKCAFALNNEIVTSIGNLAFKLGRLSLLSEGRKENEDPGESAKYTLLLMGKTLTPSQVRGLHQGEELPTIKEAKPLYDLFDKLHRLDPRSQESMLAIEKAVFPDGTPNRLSRRVAGFDYPLPIHQRIETLLKGLYTFAFNSQGKIQPLIMASLYYFEILAIAPYSSYNQIFAMIGFRQFAMAYSKELGALPLEKMFYSHQEDIAAAYKEAVEKGNTAPFVSYMISLIDSGCDTLARHYIHQGQKTTALVDKLLEKMEQGRFYSAAELCSLLNLKSRLGLQKNYIQPGLGAGVLEMSNPLCPTDRSQRYKKK